MTRIMLVDDDDEIHRKVRYWLIRGGYKVDHAGNSAEADDLLRLAAADDSYDVIVCGNSMRTDNEGLEYGAALWLKNISVPFILHTSSELVDARETMERHRIHYVQKTDSPEPLLRKIAEVLQNQSATP